MEQPQHFTERPRLERAAARRVRWITVCNLANMSQPRFIHVSQQRPDELTVEMTIDPRGFAANVTQTPKLIVAFGGRTDTVCVTGLGKITARSCP